jgi:hypothetical protein
MLGAISSAQLIFSQYMILSRQFKADWSAIQDRWQQQILHDISRENSQWIPCENKVGDKVSKTTWDPATKVEMQM